jgi:hypothetical protein
MKKVYVQEPKLAFQNDLEPSHLLLIYGLIEWEEGMFAIQHAPGDSSATRVDLLWGEGIVEVRQRAIDAILASFPDVTSNDIIFLGGWN